MKRRMYPQVDFGGVGGPNFKSKVTGDSQRKIQKEIKEFLPETAGNIDEKTSISASEFTSICDKSGLPKNVVEEVLTDMGITIKASEPFVPETTSETNATNNPRGERAAAMSEDFKKKMAEMMDKLGKENGESLKTMEPFKLPDGIDKAKLDSIADKFKHDI